MDSRYINEPQKNKNLSKFLTMISNLGGVYKKIKSMVENPKKLELDTQLHVPLNL